MDSTEMRYDKIESLPLKNELIKMIQYGPGDNWTEVVQRHLNIYEVSADSLLKYFAPLEEYLDEVEDDLAGPVSSVYEETLEKLEIEYQEKAEKALKTTTPAPITNTTPIARAASIEPSNTKTTIEQKSSSPQAPIAQTPIVSTKGPSTVEKTITTENNDKIIKSGTSKAVWAVGAVLIAIVTIVIIALFGRQRCRKTPKNRRYV